MTTEPRSPEGAPEPGLVVVDKPGGMTSHDVVARLRRLLGTRRVGHAGTLDPMATGVLVVGVGRATRLLGHLQLTEKEYAATVRLGVTTTTDDAEGEPTASFDAGSLSDDQVDAAFAAEVGQRDQVPSAVSAVKVDGRRAYARVRSGERVTLPPRRVTVHELRVVDVRRHGPTVDADIALRCSSGTYVRAVARDVGARLGVGGHLTALRRTRVGAFGLDRAATLDRLEADPAVLPVADAARMAFPALELDDTAAAAVRVGRALELPLTGLTALFDPAGSLLALYEPREGRARPVAVFG